MAIIVADASTLIAVITNEREKAAIIHHTRRADLIAPQSVHWEIGNAFSAMLRRGRVTIDEAIEALRVYATISLRLVDVELDESMKLSDALNIYAYDAHLIRCAARYRAPLLTLDRALVAAARSAGVQVLEVIE